MVSNDGARDEAIKDIFELNVEDINYLADDLAQGLKDRNNGVESSLVPMWDKEALACKIDGRAVKEISRSERESLESRLIIGIHCRYANGAVTDDGIRKLAVECLVTGNGFNPKSLSVLQERSKDFPEIMAAFFNFGEIACRPWVRDQKTRDVLKIMTERSRQSVLMLGMEGRDGHKAEENLIKLSGLSAEQVGVLKNNVYLQKSLLDCGEEFCHDEKVFGAIRQLSENAGSIGYNLQRYNTRLALRAALLPLSYKLT